VHSLVRARTGIINRPALDASGNAICEAGKTKLIAHTVEVRVSKHFGAQNPPANPNYDGKAITATNLAYLPGDQTSNCDFSGDGTVKFDNPAEKACSDSCAADVECTEWSNFASRSNFYVVINDKYKDASNKDISTTEHIQADGSTAPGFTPVPLRGQAIGSIAGTLSYFSGGTQFTIEARCADDVVTDPTKPPKPAAEACVFPRSEGQLEPQ
jgi:hypothetical protein